MSLITQILSDYWFVTPQYKEAFLPIVARIMNGGNLSFGEIRQHVKEREEKYREIQSATTNETASHERKYWTGSYFSSDGGDRVGVVKVNGIMIKEDDASTYGTETTYDMLKEAGENPGIIATALQMNTGGGNADSAPNLNDLISNYEAVYGKPIIGLVDSMAASAGYYAISGASKIILIGKGASVGSIGTMASWYDISQFLEMQGIKPVYVYADKSKDKNREFHESEAGNYEPLKEILNHLQKQFENAVKKGRGANLGAEDVFTGKMYYGLKAVQAGLADDIMTREEAMQYAWNLGRKRKKKS